MEKRNMDMVHGQMEKGEAISSYREGDIVIVNRVQELECGKSVDSEMTVLLMCKSGKVRLRVNEMFVTMQESDMLFIQPSSTLSDMMFSADADCSAICVSSLRVQNFLRTQDLLNLVLAIRKHPLLHVSDEQFQNLIKMKGYVKQMFSSNHPYYERIMSHFIEIILYDIFGSYKKGMEEVITSEANHPKRANQIFSSFITLLHEDKGIHREVRYYAGLLCITPKYLSALCKEVSGKSCTQWINETVLDRIQELLRYTDLSIREVADRLQFENYSFFGKYVRRHFGCSPGEYRHRYRVSDKLQG